MTLSDVLTYISTYSHYASSHVNLKKLKVIEILHHSKFTFSSRDVHADSPATENFGNPFRVMPQRYRMTLISIYKRSSKGRALQEPREQHTLLSTTATLTKEFKAFSRVTNEHFK